MRVSIAHSSLSIAFTYQDVAIACTRVVYCLAQSFLCFYIAGCVCSLHQSLYCLSQSFYCFYIASALIPYTGLLQLTVKHRWLPVVFLLLQHSRMCLQLTLECLVLTLVFLLPLHSECIYSCRQSVYCLLQSFYCFYIASVSIYIILYQILCYNIILYYFFLYYYIIILPCSYARSKKVKANYIYIYLF